MVSRQSQRSVWLLCNATVMESETLPCLVIIHPLTAAIFWHSVSIISIQQTSSEAIVLVLQFQDDTIKHGFYVCEGNEWRILRNKELDQKGKEPNIVEVIKINGLRWLGHVSRMADNRLPKKMFIWEGPHNKRPRGRPRIRWKDEVYKDARRLDKAWKEVIRDRDSWRRLLRMARNHRILRLPNE